MSILSGIRVIDCATYIAGPAAATVMADFGADVVKIERPPHGDPYRYLSKLPAMPQSDELYCWTLDGRNRKSLALDLQKAGARDALLRLVGRADVFITNYQPAMLGRLRLAYDQLAPLNDRLIYAHVTGFGETGPDADKPGYDTTAYWARSGLMELVHYANSDPIPAPAGLGDHPTAMSLFGGIMLALYRRQISGRGSRVSTSLLANGAWANSCNVQAALSGAQFVPRRTRATSLVPLVNHYVTRDRQRFILCCLNPPREWPLLCEAIGQKELIEDPRFASHEGRRENSAALIEILDRAIAGRDLKDWAEIFARHDLVWSLVPSMEQVAADPQLETAGVFRPIEGTGAALRTVNSPINVDGMDKAPPRRAPRVGEHTSELQGGMR